MLFLKVLAGRQDVACSSHDRYDAVCNSHDREDDIYSCSHDKVY
jgi:hypothetical protein